MLGRPSRINVRLKEPDNIKSEKIRVRSLLKMHCLYKIVSSRICVGWYTFRVQVHRVDSTRKENFDRLLGKEWVESLWSNCAD